MSAPVRLDLSEENLRQLLAQGHESETLDYKTECNIAMNDELLELTKDVAAMLMKGGYIVIGADDNGNLIKSVPPEQIRLYEQSRLKTKLCKYLAEPFDVRAKVHALDGFNVLLIYVAEHPRGIYVIGKLEQKSNQEVLFRPGDVLSRHGTSSERWNQNDIDAVEKKIVDRLKASWMAESASILKDQLPKIAAGLRAGLPSSALSWELDPDTFHGTTVELIREKDYAPLRLLFNRLKVELRDRFEEPDLQPRLENVLDHIACVGAVAIELHDLEAFDISVAGLNQVYNLPVGPQGFANVYPREASARIWLSVIQRACALGALAVRLQGWDAIAKLVSQRGQDRDFDYYYNWFRHALTMAARSELLHESRDGRQVSTTLISHALKTIDQVPCLRPDASPGDEAILNSLCQFDLLVSVATISQAYPKNDGDFYPNFARYYSERATPAARMLIVDSTLRSLLFPRDDHALASALRQVDSLARQEGARFNGWWGFRESGDRVVAKFLEDHPPSP